MLPAACLKGSVANGDICEGCAFGTYAPANATTCTNCSDGFTTLRMNSFVNTQCDRKLAAVTQNFMFLQSWRSAIVASNTVTSCMLLNGTVVAPRYHSTAWSIG